MNKALILMLASFYFCGAFFCAAVCNANDCRACRDEPIVALTYPEPYNGEDAQTQNARRTTARGWFIWPRLRFIAAPQGE